MKNMTKTEELALDVTYWIALACIVTGAFMFRTWAGFIVLGLVLGAHLRRASASLGNGSETTKHETKYERQKRSVAGIELQLVGMRFTKEQADALCADIQRRATL